MRREEDNDTKFGKDSPFGESLKEMLQEMKKNMACSSTADRYAVMATQHYNEWMGYFRMYLEKNMTVEQAGKLAREAADLSTKTMNELGILYKGIYEKERTNREAGGRE